MEKEVYLKIKGRVQGIGFRWWAVKTAEEIGGISGWVHNAAETVSASPILSLRSV